MKRVEVTASEDKKSTAQIYVDAYAHFAAAYGGGRGEYMLIRPDGYVGWVGSAEKLSELDVYLGRVSAPFDTIGAKFRNKTGEDHVRIPPSSFPENSILCDGARRGRAGDQRAKP